MIVLGHLNADIDVCFVAVVQTPEEVIAMQEFRMNIQLQMLIAKSKTTKAKYHCLKNTGCAGSD